MLQNLLIEELIDLVYTAHVNFLSIAYDANGV